MTESYSIAFGETLAAGCHFSPPAWAPAAGEIKQISHSAGHFGTNGGATLAEIDPRYQAWNPLAPAQGPYNAGTYDFWSILGYSGSCFNTDTRQIVVYGAGHASINVPAPFCFDLNDLRWKWLDTPLPFDGFKLILTNGVSVPPTQTAFETYYPAAQYDYNWGELNGNWTGWETAFGNGPWLRPGIIQPVPSHNRAHVAHVSAAMLGNAKGGMLWTSTGSGVLSGVNAKAAHLFDYDTATWSRNANKPSGSYGSGRSSVTYVAGNKVIAFGSSSPMNTFDLFDPTTKTWSQRTASSSVSTSVDGPGNVVHEKSGLLIVIGARDASGNPGNGINGITFALYAVVLADLLGSGAFSFTPLTVSVATTWPLNNLGYNSYLGWAYCPVDGCLYAIDGVGGSTKYWRLAPPANSDYLGSAWTLTEHAFVSGTLNSPSGRSFVYNRLKWDRKSRSFIWFPDSTSGAVQAFRPEGV